MFIHFHNKTLLFLFNTQFFCTFLDGVWGGGGVRVLNSKNMTKHDKAKS